MAYLPHADLVRKAIDAGEAKVFMAIKDAFVRAFMAGAMLSTTVPGKVIAMWMPIMVFLFMTFEHSIVNMFLFPAALLMGGKLSVLDYMIWNAIPTLLGNIVGGLAFTGLMLYSTHVRTGAPRNAAVVSPVGGSIAR